MSAPIDPTLLGQTGGPAGGQPAQAPTTPPPPSSSGKVDDQRVAGLQSFYDSSLAALGWGSLNKVPPAQAVQQLQADAARAKELEDQLTQHQSVAQTLAAQKQAAEQAASAANWKLTKMQTVAKLNPALMPLVDSIAVAPDADEATILAAAQNFMDALKQLGFMSGPQAAPAAAAPEMTPTPAPAPGIPAGAPPAGQGGSIDEHISEAQNRMWTFAGIDDAKYGQAERDYFAALRNKERVEGWTDTKWGKPPGLD